MDEKCDAFHGQADNFIQVLVVVTSLTGEGMAITGGAWRHVGRRMLQTLWSKKLPVQNKFVCLFNSFTPIWVRAETKTPAE